LGLNLTPALIGYLLLLWCDPFGWKCRINLAHQVIIGKVFQENRTCRALCAADPVSLAEDGINPGFAALRGLTKVYGPVITGGYAGPA
jgi:hypothetical protein